MDPVTTPQGPAATPDAPVAESEAGWLRKNGINLALVVAVVVVILRYLDPLDFLLAAGGLGLIIFIHELGHFLAAKWCDVYVKTFSIGFGPALPFCSYKWGETTYKLALVPLGGFVAMAGQEDGVVDEGEDTDPRSFRNKSVLQRMLIISAGVIMNILLAAVCFVVAYLNGVDEMPAIVSSVHPGSAAWKAGLHAGTEIKRIGTRENPWFDDIKPIVWATQKGETLPLEYEFGGKRTEIGVEPVREEGDLVPVIGFKPPDSLTLQSGRRGELPGTRPGSPAAAAKAADGGPGFLPGDTFLAATDPADRAAVTPLTGWRDLELRLAKLAGTPVTIQVRRKDPKAGPDPVSIVLPPAFRRDSGLRMRMGPVVALRTGSPAEAAGVIAKTPAGDVTGDRIVDVEMTATDGKTIRYSADTDKVQAGAAKPLDPLRLPHALNAWADRNPSDKTVRLTLLRQTGHREERVPLTLRWDDAYRYEFSPSSSPSAPVAINGLGLAYQVLAVVDAVVPGSSAEQAGLKPNDSIVAVRLKGVDDKGEVKTGKWADIQPHQWPGIDWEIQRTPPYQFDLKVKRGGDEPIEVLNVSTVDDPTWPTTEYGFFFQPEKRTQKADGVVEALSMGGYRTVRAIKSTYQNLYSMVTGRVSSKLISGPITLARVTYILAGEGPWKLILLLGIISINLAVVNFLPIPVLDGGHMMLLGYELIRRKPAPERVQIILTYLGLAAVLSLMLFAVGLDIWRLFF
jgi:regulator of sigma E protease